MDTISLLFGTVGWPERVGSVEPVGELIALMFVGFLRPASWGATNPSMQRTRIMTNGFILVAA